MRIITKIMLAFAFVGSLAFTACKDYDEDNYTNAALNNPGTIDEALRKQLADMQAAIKALQEQGGGDCSDCTAKVTALEQRVQKTEEALQSENLGKTVEALLRNNTLFLTEFGGTSLVDTIQGLGTRLDRLYRDSIKPINEWYNEHNVEGDKGFVYRKELVDSINKVNERYKKYTDDQIKLTIGDIPEGKTVKWYVDSVANVLQGVDKKMNARVDSLAGITKDLGERLDVLEDARKKQITGIIVQQVHNPAFGSYNSLVTNVQTNILVAYFGSANRAKSFPEDKAYTGEKELIFNGETLLSDNEANAGTVYLTINPNDVEFDGLDGLKLVNSQDRESAVKLGTFKKSDAVLNSGYTRAADNGFYEAPASISAEALADPNVRINIDKSAVKTALSDFIAIRDGASAKIALKDFAKVAIDVVQAMRLEALAVKCPWKDKAGEHAVYSNYNMAAVAVQPLGFEAVDAVFDKEGNGFFWRAYDQIQDFVTRAAKKVGKKIADQIDKQFMLDRFDGKLSDIYAKLDHLVKVDMDEFHNVELTAKVTIPEIKLEFDVPVTEQEINVGKIYVEVPDVYNPVTGEWTTALKEVVFEGNPTVSGGKVHVKHTIPAQTVDAKVTMTKEEFTEVFQPIINNINNNYDDIDEVFDAFKSVILDVNTMIDNINKLEDKLENATYLNRVFAYLDKFANKFANAVPAMFKPVLLVSSDKGFGVAGFGNNRVPVAGQVTVIPTTYSAELLAPIYKRYIRVNDNPGQILDSRTLDITSQLKKGPNEVYYEAMDYTGYIDKKIYTLYFE